jgi:hypothetical protein
MKPRRLKLISDGKEFVSCSKWGSYQVMFTQNLCFLVTILDHLVTKIMASYTAHASYYLQP